MLESNVISFAASQPCAETAPVEALAELTDGILPGDARGLAPLIDAVGRFVEGKRIAAEPDQILVTDGRQHALDP